MKKDLNWFKEQLDDIEMNTPRVWSHDSIWMLDRVHELLSQLDEPEVLSQEWIEGNTSPVDDEGRLYIWKRDLQNLLVPTLPKKKKVQLSQKAADELNRYKELGYSLRDLLVIAGSKQAQEKFARAWLDGFTAEEEQKYYVLDSEDIPLLERANNQTCKTTTGLSIYEDGRDNSRFELTEQEIKDYDERYWVFVKEVDS